MPNPPPPPGPLEKPSSSSSGTRSGAPGFFGRLAPRSALTILAVAGIAYSILIDNPFRPGQESVLREGVKEYAYWKNGGMEAQELKAAADVDEARRRADEAELAAAQAGSKLAPPISLSGGAQRTDAYNVDSADTLNGALFKCKLNDGIVSKEEIPLLAEVWRLSTHKNTLDEAFSKQNRPSIQEVEMFITKARPIISERSRESELVEAALNHLTDPRSVEWCE